MQFEKPQKGNPHQFVMHQHFHTAHCIQKFYGKDNKIEVRFLNTGAIKKYGKKSSIF